MTANMTHCLELKRSLTTICKDESQSMEAHLRSINVIVDFVAAINSFLSDHVQFTLFGLDHEYESFVTVAACFGSNLTVHDLRNKLLLYEQHVFQLKDHATNPITHQALATNMTLSSTTSTNDNWHRNTNSNRGGRGNSWHGRCGRGRGGGSVVVEIKRATEDSPPPLHRKMPTLAQLQVQVYLLLIVTVLVMLL